jgi:triosephosphate isomerase (TIM)
MTQKTPLICFNWKMNPKNRAEAKELIETYLKYNGNNENVILFPPATYLSELSKYGITLGGQDISGAIEGAFTGQISGRMLVDQGCKYVLAGHSEVRKHHSVSNGSVHQKVHQAWDSGLIPILCISYTRAENTHNQLKEAIEVIFHGRDQIKGDIVLAFEPLSAIGSGVPMNSVRITHYINFIKTVMTEKGYPDVRVMYGGSVSSNNILELSKIKNLDGFLIGKSSLDKDEVTKILNSKF